MDEISISGESDRDSTAEMPAQRSNLPSVGLMDARHDSIGSTLADRVAAALLSPWQLQDYQASSCQYGSGSSTESATFQINEKTKITVRLSVSS